MIFFISLLVTFLFFFAPASAQEVVMMTGEVVGTISLGGTCAPRSETCITFQNDNRANYPVEVVEVSYLSTQGQISILSPPVMGARLQCVLPNDVRPCVPVMARRDMGAMELLVPPAPGELIMVRLRAWDPPGAEGEKLPQAPMQMGEIMVTLLGDPVAAMQVPATPVAEVTIRLEPGVSNFANWRKGR